MWWHTAERHVMSSIMCASKQIGDEWLAFDFRWQKIPNSNSTSTINIIQKFRLWQFNKQAIVMRAHSQSYCRFDKHYLNIIIRNIICIVLYIIIDYYCLVYVALKYLCWTSCVKSQTPFFFFVFLAWLAYWNLIALRRRDSFTYREWETFSRQHPPIFFISYNPIYRK